MPIYRPTSASAPLIRYLKTIATPRPNQKVAMGKKNKIPITEAHLELSRHPDIPESVRIVDTHTHLLSTYAAFRTKFPDTQLLSLQDWANHYLKPIDAVVDVWCDAPVEASLEEVANLPDENWPFTYRFVVGIHPHDAAKYDDHVEGQLLRALAHPKNIGFGEIGLDYHYDNSPREVQKDVLRRQLRLAIQLEKPLTIHTREADEDIYHVLTEMVPKEWKIHVHCFTDSPELAIKLLNHFPNLYIGITGVLTYSSNTNTTEVIKHMATLDELPRLLGETDAPYMTPTNLPLTEMGLKNQRLPLCHSAMLPWTIQAIAEILGGEWTTASVCQLLSDNARKHYSV